MPKLPIKMLEGLGDVLRLARAKPRIATSEWVGRGPGEEVLSALADKLNKIVPQASPVEFAPTPEQMKLALNAEMNEAKRYLANADKWDPKDPEGRARHVAFLEARLNELLKYQDVDPSKYPPTVKRMISSQYSSMPETWEAYHKVETPSTPAEQAIKTYRQNPAAFQEMTRKGKLSKALVDSLKEDALLGGDYAKGVADVTQKEALLSQLVDQPLALKRKLALFRGLELPSSVEGSGLFGSGYGSFSYDPNVALGFVGNATPSRTGILTRMKPKGQEGLRGLDVSDDRFNPSGGAVNDVENELEVLLAPKQGFQIVNPRLSTKDELLLDVEYDPTQVGGMTYYAEGGKVKPTYNTQNPMDHGLRNAELAQRIARAKSTGAGIKKGALSWAPDVAGFFLGDIPDAAAYVWRRAKNVQGEQSIPSLGAGAKVRRKMHDIQAALGLEPKFVPPTGQVVGPVYEPSTVEEVVQFANPLTFVTPSTAVTAVRGAGHGAAQLIARAAQSEGPLARMATAGFRPMNVVKSKGGNWQTGSVEDTLRWLKPSYDPVDDAHMDRLDSLNNWIDKALTKYVKNEMATPEDPIRTLAEQGVLHYAPAAGFSSRLVNERTSAGFPGMGVGNSPLAQSWEGVADEALRGSFFPNPYKPGEEMRVFAPTRSMPETLGFPHLIDELSNAINPESGLPRHLQFPADRLSKVSVPQAVQRVSDINKWRAEQKVIADAARANNAATVLHKEYPEKGMKWVELANKVGKDRPEGEYVAGIDALRDALKYEGDIMGHCVGGYCDDVVSGRSRIFSLRDAKGEPHVTIETSPQGAVFSDVVKYIGEEEANKLLDQGVTLREMIQNIPNFEHRQRIVQIKGKQNRAPNPEYLPFVQDFVRSGQWSDVGDLHNTGLMKHPTGKYVSDAEANALARRHFGDDIKTPWQYANRIRRYDSDMLSDIDKAFLADWDAGNFAQGGSVPNKIETVGQLRSIIAALSKGPAHG